MNLLSIVPLPYRLRGGGMLQALKYAIFPNCLYRYLPLFYRS